jgi:muramidase (phage lysozyme)
MLILSQNVKAFLSTISHSEGTDRAPDPYRCCFEFKHTIASFADHPAVTGEWMGESLAFLGPQYANEKSTAAGRYQINRPTWVGIKTLLQLPDFGPDSQDQACVHLIRTCHALDLVEAGEIRLAIFACRGRWASLPGNTSGQPQKPLADLLDAYGSAGGTLA